jgi:hypothetical protein
VPACRLTNSAASPGPGAYESASTFGKQTRSKKKTNPIPKFGTSQRSAVNKQYISAKHAKLTPSSYSSESYYGDLAGTTSMGKMPNSKLKSAANTRFS